MLKSLEDYLANLDFDAPEPAPGKASLDSGERIFVEKYLGLDAAEFLPVQDPEPVPLPAPVEEKALLPLAEPEIIVAAPKIEIKARPVETLEKAPEIVVAAPEQVIIAAQEKLTEQVKVESRVEAKTESAQEVSQAVIVEPRIATESVVETAIAEPVTATKAAVKAEAAEPAAIAETVTAEPVAAMETAVKAEVAEPLAVTETVVEAKAAEPVTVAATESQPAALARIAEEELGLREKMRQAAEIQVVSFFISGQLFLLPVAGIQEVLRHMELVRVPQAPPYVAGAINLRGTVMPLIHLSALLTNSGRWDYDESSFIIVTGSTSVQMGLIIDKVSSMHMIPQSKIIWNVESKLGDAAEFLSALVDLDDRVCGMISPETITQKLLTEF